MEQQTPTDTPTATSAPSAPAASSDLSSRTVFVLVMLVVVVSFIGAWVNINQAMSPTQTIVKNEAPAAHASFTIQHPEDKLDTNAGMAVFKIENP